LKPRVNNNTLNLGLTLSQTEFVAPFDVDLIPIGDRDTFKRHLQLAILAPKFLVTRYRVMVEQETVNIDELDTILEQTSIAPEDKPTPFWKHLIRGERFGVVPLK
jgi:hypothetical protein